MAAVIVGLSWPLPAAFRTGLDPSWRAALHIASADPLFANGSVRTPDGLLSLVYKAAAEIGELGDNTRHLRAANVEPA